MQTESLVGKTLTCAETGAQFIGAPDGCSTNYARTSAGEILSDAGVDARERRELLDRSRPFTCYLSSDGKHITGWKGNILGTVTSESKSRTGWHGSYITHIRATDVHGNPWHGKGAGRGMCITIRASRA